MPIRWESVFDGVNAAGGRRTELLGSSSRERVMALHGRDEPVSGRSTLHLKEDDGKSLGIAQLGRHL